MANSKLYLCWQGRCCLTKQNQPKRTKLIDPELFFWFIVGSVTHHWRFLELFAIFVSLRLYMWRKFCHVEKFKIWTSYGVLSKFIRFCSKFVWRKICVEKISVEKKMINMKSVFPFGLWICLTLCLHITVIDNCFFFLDLVNFGSSPLSFSWKYHKT